MNNRLFNWLKNANNKIENSNLVHTLQGNGSNKLAQILGDNPQMLSSINDLGFNNKKKNIVLPYLQIDENEQLIDKPLPHKFSLNERLLGKEELHNPQSTYIDNENENIKISSGVNASPRQGGLLRDIAGGFNENMHNNFQLDNLNDKIADNGSNKGIAFRIGEGLGTAAKFANSPLGRMGITAAAIGAFGGSPLEMAAYGAKAGVGNQQNVMRDKLYRKSLSNMGLNTSDVNGYIDDKTYQNYALSSYRNNSLALRSAIAGASDNTKRANLIMQGLNNGSISPEEAKYHMLNYGIGFEDLQKSNATRNADVNQYLAPHKANAYDTGAMGTIMNANTNLARLNEQQQQNEFNNAMKVAEFNEKIKNSNNEYGDIEKQLDNFRSTFKDMPSKQESYTFGALRNLTGTQTEKEANFNAQRTLLFNQIARKLGGEKGVLSDFDIKRIEAALPNLTDSYKQKEAKIKAVYDLLDIKKGKTDFNDPLGIR